MIKYIGILVLFITVSVGSQENEFFIKLSQKDIATINDGITLVRLLYNEKDNNAVFIDNLLWAAEKKLFQVKIPIKPDEINPVLTRREFAYWICKVFNTKGGIINRESINRFTAYKICVKLGIIPRGRGAYDSFTGEELIEAFSYLDYYYKNNPKEGPLDTYDTYRNLPEWRQKLYRELEEQRQQEKEAKEERRKIREQRRLEKRQRQNIKEKNIERNDENSDKEKKLEE